MDLPQRGLASHAPVSLTEDEALIILGIRDLSSVTGNPGSSSRRESRGGFVDRQYLREKKVAQSGATGSGVPAGNGNAPDLWQRESSRGDMVVAGVPDTRLTVMIRGIPRSLTHEQIEMAIDIMLRGRTATIPHHTSYTREFFVQSVPGDTSRKRHNRGYAFVRFDSTAVVQRLAARLEVLRGRSLLQAVVSPAVHPLEDMFQGVELHYAKNQE